MLGSEGDVSIEKQPQKFSVVGFENEAEDLSQGRGECGKCLEGGKGMDKDLPLEPSERKVALPTPRLQFSETSIGLLTHKIVR